jgi:alanine or glycine:cation symporter, AGCS family
MEHLRKFIKPSIALILSLLFIAACHDASFGQTEAAATASATEATAEPEAESGIAKSIDDFFGTFLVTPLGSVLMFDVFFGLIENVKLPFVVAWLLIAAVFLTFRMGFISIRGFYHGVQLVRGKYDDPSEPGEVTHFQALSSALSATVGLGNIGGVAIAVGLGGPGATFWMILLGFLGMTSKFAECTLGLLYRKVDENGRVLGGPMRYLKVGLESMQLSTVGSVLSVVFAVCCIGASFGGGNAYQVGQSLGVLKEAGALSFLVDYPIIYGIVMAIAVGLVIIGGIKSIGNVASLIVPVMCLAYIAAVTYIIVTHLDQLPTAISRIIIEAFQPKAAIVGGAVYVMVQGVKRAVFSNEAGVGSAAIAHSAAKTDEPVSEGIVALLEPFVDTVIVCTFTALAIVITGVAESDAGKVFVTHTNGAALTRLAFIEGGRDWFAYVLYGCVVMFAYSTCISWSYYGERCWVMLFGNASSIYYKVLFLIFTVLGSIVSLKNILEFSDLMILAMSVPNLIGVYLMSGVIKRKLDEYWAKYKSGALEPSVKYAQANKGAS